MGRTLAFVYGVVSYVVFLLTFLYAIGFVLNVFVPKTIDTGGPDSPFAAALLINAALLALSAFGWLMVLLSTYVINHYDLFGLRQVYLNLRGREYTYLPFKVSAFYKFVRHPLLLGFIIAFWATPAMTVGHLVFAAATTAYMLIAIQLEERDLESFHSEYAEYKRRVPMLIPLPGKKAAVTPEPVSEESAV